MTDAVHGKGDAVRLAEQAGQKREMVVPAAVVAQQLALGGPHARTRLLHAAWPAADVEDALCRQRGTPHGRRAVVAVALEHRQFAPKQVALNRRIVGPPLQQRRCRGHVAETALQARPHVGAGETILGSPGANTAYPGTPAQSWPA